jgi:hypothetical protein
MSKSDKKEEVKNSWLVFLVYKDKEGFPNQMAVELVEEEESEFQARAKAIGIFMVMRHLKMPSMVDVLRCCRGTRDECLKFNDFLERSK